MLPAFAICIFVSFDAALLYKEHPSFAIFFGLVAIVSAIMITANQIIIAIEEAAQLKSEKD